jgi:uncharacterized membrane protein YkoI
MVRSTRLATFAAALAATAATAYAATAKADNDALGIDKAPFGLTQAIAAAEQQHPGGKAAKAEFERAGKDGWVYEVEVVGGARVFDVRVDPQKGTVISSSEDKPDRGEDHEDRD